MANRTILTIRDHRLQLEQQSLHVTNFNRELRALISEMFEVMYAAPGIGLAAVQIGIHQRIITIDVAKKDDPPNRRVFINPEVTWSSPETQVHEEGCLSIPEVYEDVQRPAAVRVKYWDEYGRFSEEQATGLLAICLQHEIDHTNGRLFLHHISRVRRERIFKSFAKAKREAKITFARSQRSLKIG
jgi:peptide deformylase